MLNRAWIRLWALLSPSESTNDTLASILSREETREAVLGIKKKAPDSPEAILRDANHIVQYSQTDDYAVWAKEAWTQAVSCIAKLTEPKTSAQEADFYRGSLSSILDMLRVSNAARESLTRQTENTRPILKQI